MMNAHPIKMTRNLWRYRDLIRELARRELSQRYRGSYLGFIWTLIVPLITLAIYTFVFAFIFDARWATSSDQPTTVNYALVLFAGLTAYNIFSEVVSLSTTLIIKVPNYVKKVVFPLEIYPIVIISVAVILSLVNVGIIVLANLILTNSISSNLYLLPIAYIPLIFLCMAMSWFLASLGVYIRDLAQVIPVLLTIMFFLSPIVYPIEAVPEQLQPILYLNPLTTITECFRQSLLWSGAFPWVGWSIWTLISFGLAMLGYAWFMGTKKGFADVL